jgi:hypothetical protein
MTAFKTGLSAKSALDLLRLFLMAAILPQRAESGTY